jgi:hypothetical protein
MLLGARMTATSDVDYNDDSYVPTHLCCIARSNNDKRWLTATKARVPSNNQPNFTLHHSSEQQPRNNNTIDAMMTPYVMLQEATTMATMVDCNKQARLRQ